MASHVVMAQLPNTCAMERLEANASQEHDEESRCSFEALLDVSVGMLDDDLAEVVCKMGEAQMLIDEVMRRVAHIEMVRKRLHQALQQSRIRRVIR